jgi:hypothetical protein
MQETLATMITSALEQGAPWPSAHAVDRSLIGGVLLDVGVAAGM